GVEGFVKVSNINGNLRLTENLEIQHRISKSIIGGALKTTPESLSSPFNLSFEWDFKVLPIDHLMAACHR
ncbi:MAG: hypothetical protein OXE99_14545, partial [Cellvibrionales bacterium]|nr:hypothetical protein [Cellvibrionales bacterium]